MKEARFINCALFTSRTKSYDPSQAAYILTSDPTSKPSNSSAVVTLWNTSLKMKVVTEVRFYSKISTLTPRVNDYSRWASSLDSNHYKVEKPLLVKVNYLSSRLYISWQIRYDTLWQRLLMRIKGAFINCNWIDQHLNMIEHCKIAELSSQWWILRAIVHKYLFGWVGNWLLSFERHIYQFLPICLYLVGSGKWRSKTKIRT